MYNDSDILVVTHVLFAPIGNSTISPGFKVFTNLVLSADNIDNLINLSSLNVSSFKISIIFTSTNSCLNGIHTFNFRPGDNIYC